MNVCQWVAKNGIALYKRSFYTSYSTDLRKPLFVVHSLQKSHSYLSMFQHKWEDKNKDLFKCLYCSCLLNTSIAFPSVVVGAPEACCCQLFHAFTTVAHICPDGFENRRSFINVTHVSSHYRCGPQRPHEVSDVHTRPPLVIG